MVGIRQNGDNLVLEFRCELRCRSREHFCRRRRWRDRLVRDKRAAEHDIHIEQAFAIQRFCHLVAGLLHQALLFFRERDALFSPDNEEAVCPITMLEGHPKQRLRARCNQAEANSSSILLVVRGGRCSDGLGRQCSEDGLNIARCEASCGMADQRALVTVEHGGERRVDRQLVDHGCQGPLEMRFGNGFTLWSCGCHS